MEKMRILFVLFVFVFSLYSFGYCLNYKLEKPNKITIDSKGYLYVIGSRNNRYNASILRLDPKGQLNLYLSENLFDCSIGGNNVYVVGQGVDMGRNITLKDATGEIFFKDRANIGYFFKYLQTKPSVKDFLHKLIQPTGQIAINSKGQLCVIGWGLERVEIGMKGIAWFPNDNKRKYTQEFWKQRIGILDPKDGHPLIVFGETGTGVGQAITLQDIDTDAQDNIYVADNMLGKIMKFDKNGKFIKEWGRWGRKEGEFYGLRHMAVDKKNNRVYTGEDIFASNWDEGMHRVQKFTTDGQFLAEWGGKDYQPSSLLWRLAPWNKKEYMFYSVQGIDVDKDGNVWVLSADPERCSVRKYNPDGKELMRFGEGILNRAGEGLAVAPNGDVFVCDIYKNRIMRFNKDGKYLGEIK